MALLLGIDFSTSYYKVGLFDATGTLRGLGRVTVAKQSPEPGRSELPEERFWQLLREALSDAVAQAHASYDDIVGLSYLSQANTFVLLDGNNEPLDPLVIWSDRRADPLEPAVREFGDAEKFRRAVGPTLPRARALLGLPAEVRFAVGVLDHYMAAIRSGLDRFGDASISTGTVLAALQLVERVEPVGGCYHGPHFDGRFYRLAFDPAEATQLEDYQRQYAPHLSIAQLAALAATVPHGAILEPLPRKDAEDRRHATVVRCPEFCWTGCRRPGRCHV
jgi:sugar (pentulose or hexulose) kinase